VHPLHVNGITSAVPDPAVARVRSLDDIPPYPGTLTVEVLWPFQR
jgi:hypothetical protein